MRKAKVHVKGVEAGVLTEIIKGKEYTFEYVEGYNGPEVSRTVPVSDRVFTFDSFLHFLRDYCRKGSSWKGC